MTRPRAWTRPPSGAFRHALGQVAGAPPPELREARSQHRAYCDALTWAGYDVIELAPCDGMPDACFIEDVAVIAGERALLTRPGAKSRRREVDVAAADLASAFVLDRMTEPATLDGGDVLRGTDRFIVGLSSRTNLSGAEALRAWAARDGRDVVVAAVRGALHLKCHLSSPIPGLIVSSEAVDIVGWPAETRWLRVPISEAYAANLVGYGNRVVVPAGFPKTVGLLHELRVEVREVDVSQFALADGSLTCLSLRES